MPSDIYVKKNTGWSTPVTSIKAKTSSGWSTAAKFVYAKINAGWTRVWPLSGVYPNTNPFISNNTATTSEISYGTVLRVGNTYKGDRGSWNANGFTISSYNYKWLAYVNDTSTSTNFPQDFQSLTTQTNALTITGTSAANFDKGWISFVVRANASNSAYSGTAGSLRYYVVRQRPRISVGTTPSFNITTPKTGDTISYSSSWDTTDAYKPEAERTTIFWYKNSTATTTGGTLVQTGGYSYVVQSTDLGSYIYVIETSFNSGSDYDLGLTVGVSATAITNSAVSINPLAPTTLTATSNRTDGVQLTWNNVSGANYYEIYWQSSQGTGPIDQSTFADFGQNNTITTNSFLDTTIAANATRYYRVRSRIDSVSSGTNCSGWYPAPSLNAVSGTRLEVIPGTFTYSIDNGTNTPSWPSGAGINISGSASNVMTVSWNAATNANAGTGTGEFAYGDQVSGVYNSSLYRLNFTSDTWSYSSSGNESATIYAYNYNKASTISWGAASNAGSYKVNFTLSGASGGNGTYTSAALSSSTLSYTITVGTGGGTVVVNSVSAFTSTDGSGINYRSGTLSGTSTNTPTFTSISSTSGNFFLTYTAPATAPVNTPAPLVTPSSGTAGSTTYSSTTGTWTGNPTPTYTYQWQYNDQGSLWLAAPGTNSNSTYLPPPNYVSIYGNYLKCRVTATNSAAPSGVQANSNTVTVSAPSVIPTITMQANSGITQTSGTINWTSTNQASFSSSGTISGTGSTGTSVTNNSLSAGTNYTGTVTVTSSTGNTAQANYSLTTSAAPANRTAPAISSVVKSGSSYLVYFAGGTTGGAYQVWWQTSSSTPSNCGPGDAQGTSSPVTVNNLSASAGSTYYFFVRSTTSTSTSDCGPSSTASSWSSAFSYIEPSNPSTPPVPVVVAPAITSGPGITWASGNNFTLSASASNATNLEFQVEFANNNGGPALSTQTFFFGASTGGGTTGDQSYSWGRTRVRANNSSTGLSSSFSGYTGWA